MASSKVYIGNLGEDGDKEAIEQEFSKFGLIKDVWIARNPPGFAFVVYNDSRDAEEAVRVMDNKRLCGTKIKVELSHTEDDRHPRKNDRGGRGRGFARHDQDREPQSREFTMRPQSSSRSQFSRGPPPRDSSSRRPSYDSTRMLQPRGPPARGPSMRTAPQRRSPDRLDNGGPFRERERYSASGPSRDRYAHERNSSQYDDAHDRYRNDGHRRAMPPLQNGHDRYSDKYSDRIDDRYSLPTTQERFRDSFMDRAQDRGADRGQDRFGDRGLDRSMDRGSDRFGGRHQEPRYSRRSPPPTRGPPMGGRISHRSPPPRRGGRSPIARGWGRSRSPIR